MKLTTQLALAFCLAATPALAQTSPERKTPEPPASQQPAQTAPPRDANANAPKGPALAEEPHGGGSVYEELDAIKRDKSP